MRRMSFGFLLAGLLALPCPGALAGQRHHGLRDCRVRETPMVFAPEGFTAPDLSPTRPAGLLMGFTRKSEAGESVIQVQQIPKNFLGDPLLADVQEKDITAFLSEDPRVRMLLEDPVFLHPQNDKKPITAWVRRVIGPVTGKWAKLAYVDAKEEILRVELVSSSQAAYGEGEAAFEEVLTRFFARFDDPPRYKVVACENR